MSQIAPGSGGLSRRALLGALGAVGMAGAGLASAGCGRQTDYPAGHLRIATGGQGGVYYAYGNGIVDVVRAELPLLSPEVLVTAASLENLGLVATGKAEVAFTLADSAALAFLGDSRFDAPLAIAALARLYDNYLHLVFRLDSPLQTIDQLRGRRVSVGAAGSGTELIAGRLLGAAGIDVDRDVEADRLGVDDSAAALAGGRLDAFFFSGGIPTAAIAALAATVPIGLADLEAQVPDLRSRYGGFYTERTIPASPYRLADSVTTVGTPNYLVVAAAMDQRLAYHLVRALFARRDIVGRAHPEGRRLDRGSAISTYPVPLHAGARRYYRESKR
jgi:uncharacterized protein